MQVIAPDFYAPFGGPSSATKEERPGDGLFDALLREDEARYQAEPPPRHEAAEPARPSRVESDPREESDYGEPRHDEPNDEKPRHNEARRDDLPSEAQPDQRDSAVNDREAGAAGNGDDHDMAEGDRSAAAATRSGRAETADAAVDEPQAQGPTPSGDSHSAAVTPETGSAAALATEAAAGPAAAIPVARGAESTIAAPSPALAQTPQDKPANANPAAADGRMPAAAQQTSAATGGATGGGASAPVAAATQPASAAAPAQIAAGKASATATSKDPNQAAAVNRQSPAAASAVAPTSPAERASRAAGAARAALTGDQNVVVQTSDALTSRPAASLGGAAATAAMAQATNPAATGRPGSASKNTETSLSGNAKGAASPPAPTAKGPGSALAAATDKIAQANQAPLAPGAGSGDGAGGNAGQPTTPTVASGVASSAPAQSSGFAETLAASRSTPTANPAEQVAVQVRRAQVAGQDKISIKLHPAELGRIEVKLESNNDGTLRAVISAERSETLDLLQRDARGLERALQDAGVKTDSGSLNFNLRGQGQGQQAEKDGNFGRGGRDGKSTETELPDAAAAAAAPARSGHDGALDIQV
ncbi:MAG: flagellar hook-length control protein FliK [Kiloniellaceae bacterium]